MTPTPEAAQAAFDVVKRCVHVMDHADADEVACACYACIAEAIHAATERAARIVETYPWTEPHIIHLRLRGETEMMQKIVAKIRQGG